MRVWKLDCFLAVHFRYYCTLSYVSALFQVRVSGPYFAPVQTKNASGAEMQARTGRCILTESPLLCTHLRPGVLGSALGCESHANSCECGKESFKKVRGCPEALDTRFAGWAWLEMRQENTGWIFYISSQFGEIVYRGSLMWILCLLSNMMWTQKTWRRRMNFLSFLKKTPTQNPQKPPLDSTRGPAQQGPCSRCNEEHMVLAGCTQMTNTLTPCAPLPTHRGAFTCSPLPPGPLNARTQYNHGY